MSDPAEVRHLDPIGLDDLVVAAALQTRVDRKYVLTRQQAALVPALLPRDARALDIDGVRRFRYASLYLDTDDLVSYRMAAQRRRRRFKVRVRQYQDTGSQWVEVKTRRGRHTVKDRMLVPPGTPDVTGMDGDRADFVRDVLATAGVTGIDPRTLIPVLHTQYRRTTLYLPGSGSRVTIDTELRFSTAGTGRTLAVPDLAVVETKTGSTACVVDRALWSRGIRPTRISKYGTGLAALNPDLPQARWRRLIRTRFTVDRHSPGPSPEPDLTLLRSAS